MNAARLAALTLAVSLTLAAVSGVFSTAAAQGGGVDTPTGYGSLTPVSGDPESGAVPSIGRGLGFMRLIAQGHSPFVSAFLAWTPGPGFALVSSNRPATTLAGRRPSMGPASRQRTLPTGR